MDYYQINEYHEGHPNNDIMEDNIMNIYEKVQLAKLQLLEKDLKKSGRNNFSKYDYFELGDFLPYAITICNNLKLMTYVTFTKESASLHVVNAEEPSETLIIESPMAGAELKGMHDIQNMGAVQTYQRRYLYISLFDISENDYLDLIGGQNKPKKSYDTTYKRETIPMKEKDISTPFDLDDDNDSVISKADANVLFKMCYVGNVANWKPLNELCKEYGYDKATNITYKDYETILSELKIKMMSN